MSGFEEKRRRMDESAGSSGSAGPTHAFPTPGFLIASSTERFGGKEKAGDSLYPLGKAEPEDLELLIEMSDNPIVIRKLAKDLRSH